MLTSIKIDRLKPQAKTKKYSDRDGLTVEVRPSGSKVFIFRFQWKQKAQTITLGRYPAISLAQARDLASKYRCSVNNGIDPRDIIRGSKKREQTIFRNVAQSWYLRHSPQWRDSTSQKHMRCLERDIYPYIGELPIDALTKSDLLELIQPHELRGHHEIAHRIHDRLKAIFDFALAVDLTSNYPFNGLKKALIPKPKIKNQLAIDPTGAHEMLLAISNSKGNAVTKLYVEILAHLFVRPSELRLAKWCEFNLQTAEWHIPIERMKMAAPHLVPLSKYVISLLRELRLHTGFTPYLFTSSGTSGIKPISETSARKLLHVAGYKGRHTLHGFRALASTVLHSESHFRSDAIEAQLAHKIQGVRGVYMRADFKRERHELMEWYGKWIASRLSLPDTQNEVVNAT